MIFGWAHGTSGTEHTVKRTDELEGASKNLSTSVIGKIALS